VEDCGLYFVGRSVVEVVILEVSKLTFVIWCEQLVDLCGCVILHVDCLYNQRYHRNARSSGI
jgi:hypothetical protein